MADDRSDRIAAETARLQSQEAHKRMLHDRTIGGPMVPRPSPEFIRQNAGELKSNKQIEQEATKRVDTQLRQEAVDQQRNAEVERSWDRHNEAVARKQREGERGADREGKLQSNRERLRDQPGREGVSARERMAQGVSGREEREQTRGRAGRGIDTGLER